LAKAGCTRGGTLFIGYTLLGEGTLFIAYKLLGEGTLFVAYKLLGEGTLFVAYKLLGEGTLFKKKVILPRTPSFPKLLLFFEFCGKEPFLGKRFSSPHLSFQKLLRVKNRIALPPSSKDFSRKIHLSKVRKAILAHRLKRHACFLKKGVKRNRIL